MYCKLSRPKNSSVTKEDLNIKFNQNCFFKTSFLCRLYAQTLPAANPPKHKIHPFSKIAVTLEPVMRFGQKLLSYSILWLKAPFPTPMAWRRCKYIDLGKALKKTIESVIIIIPRWTSPPSFLRSAIPFFALVFDELGNQVSLQTNFGNVWNKLSLCFGWNLPIKCNRQTKPFSINKVREVRSIWSHISKLLWNWDF